MKRHRQTNRVPVESTPRPSGVSLHAGGVWAKTAAPAPLQAGAQPDADGRVWARYIGSRMKQFGTR
jgi:hypothetical protein